MRQGPFVITRKASKLKNKLFRMRKVLILLSFLQIIIIIGIYSLYQKSGKCVLKYKKIVSAVSLSEKHQSGQRQSWNQALIAELTNSDINWRSISKRKPVLNVGVHEKWIVLTTINNPTKDVAKLAAIRGWKVVVVGDTKTPQDWSHPNCIFLSVETQRNLGYRIIKLLPYKSYARKNIGYLFAIQHGAQIIYETDDDNSPTSGRISFFQEQTGQFLVYKTNTSLINPYEHFGQSTIWPRGYPLENIADPPQHTFEKCEGIRPLIQQGVVNGDPDVDAIFRLTRKDTGTKLQISFDSDAEPVALPPFSFTPYNSQNTLFLKDALWSLMLPTTTTMRVCDIWRGYWAQRLLWDINGYLTFFPPNAFQDRSAHNYLMDFIEERQIYHSTGKLVEFLKQWKSGKSDFFSRVLDLSVAMANDGFWEMKDALLTEAWLKDLISVGYKQPQVNQTPRTCSQVIPGKGGVKLPKEQPSSYIKLGKKLKNILKKEKKVKKVAYERENFQLSN